MPEFTPEPVPFRTLFELLRGQVDAGSWWPADTDFEMIAGAILVQNTAWGNAQRAIANLADQGSLDPVALLALDQAELGALIRPCGYFATKARYLRAAAKWFIERGEEAASQPDGALRTELLQIRGIGGETADAIMLYVYKRPVFIWDAYARRLLAAAGWGDFQSYEQARRALDPHVASAEFTVEELALFHGLIVEAGKTARSLGGWDKAFEHLAAGRFIDGGEASS